MPLQGEYAPSSSEWVRDQVEEIESSGGTEGTLMQGVPVIVITSVGADSGKRNLVEHPLVEVQDGPHRGDYTARELSGAEREQWWERAVAVWPDYAEYQKKTDRQIPVFVLEPAG